ncbi:MAG: DUF4279 domain-containing protein [Alphaproteobacteria bacterium]
MKHYRYRISLRLWHPALDPNEITAALGIAPKFSWKANDPRTTPRGDPLMALPYSYWSGRGVDGNSRERSLPDGLSNMLTELQPNKPLFDRVNSDGGKVELFVGWWLEDENSGEVFESELLKEFSDLGVRLSLDIYFDPPQR